ncbi:MAG: glycosyltransferase family 2 protein [Melioribacteraceae bacterium]
MMSQPKICAVVVTYNRLEQLKQCIESLKKQTRTLDEILIINNSSTDGTEEWLKKQNDLIFITQVNIGGAGGFYTGIKTAYEKGFDWIWCMDDDGFPDLFALENLDINSNYELFVLNSLVVSTREKEKLAFFLYDLDIKKPYKTLKELKGKKSINGGCFFNGTLINSKIVQKIGLPIKELYIHGDEIEYSLRILQNGYSIRTIANSIFYHPPAEVKIYTLGKFYHAFYKVSETKRYYRMRNLVLLYRKYHYYSTVRLFKVFICDCTILLFSREIKLLFRNIKGFYDGIFYESNSHDEIFRKKI